MRRAALLLLLLGAPLAGAAAAGSEPWEFGSQKESQSAAADFDPRLSVPERVLGKARQKELLERRLRREVRERYGEAVTEIDRKGNVVGAARRLRWAIARLPEPGAVETDKGSFEYHPYLQLARVLVAQDDLDGARRCLARERVPAGENARRLFEELNAQLAAGAETARQREAALSFARWVASGNAPLPPDARDLARAAQSALEALPRNAAPDRIQQAIEPLRAPVGAHLAAVHGELTEFGRAPFGGFAVAPLAECPKAPSALPEAWAAELRGCGEALQQARTRLVRGLCAAAEEARLAPPAFCAAGTWPDWPDLRQVASRVGEAREAASRPVKPVVRKQEPPPEPEPEPPAPPPAPVAWPAEALPILRRDFATLAGGDLDGAVRGLRGALAAHAFGERTSAAALARASLAYFLTLKAASVPPGDTEVRRLVEADAQAQARAARRADPQFVPPAPLFPESFRARFEALAGGR